MAKISLEDTLEALGKLRGHAVTPETLGALRKALASSSNHVVAKAAQVVGELQIESLTAEMSAAFDRFMSEPGKTDKGCRAKQELAEALYQVGANSDVVFTRGIRHVQMEPVFGGKADTAINLRGSCAIGLVRMGHPDTMTELADLLADREAPARIMAARALGYSQSPDGLPLLRFKAKIGDVEPAVVGECCAAMLKINASVTLPFAADLLRGDEEVAEQVAIAMGSSRLPGALPILTAWFERTLDDATRKIALVSIAMLRMDAAIEFLLTQVREASHSCAAAAVEGLSIYRHDPVLRERVLTAVENRGEKKLKAIADEALTE